MCTASLVVNRPFSCRLAVNFFSTSPPAIRVLSEVACLMTVLGGGRLTVATTPDHPVVSRLTKVARTAQAKVSASSLTEER